MSTHDFTDPRRVAEIGRQIKDNIAAARRAADKGLRCCPICWRWHNHAQILEPPVSLGTYWKYEKCADCVLSAEHGA